MKQTAYQLDAEKIAELESLIPYATDRQADKIRAVIDCGGYRAASRKMGLHQGNVSKDIMAVRKRAEKAGYHLSPGLLEAAKRARVSPLEVQHGWLKDDGASLFVGVQKPNIERDTLERIRETFEGLTAAEPTASAPEHTEADLLTLYPISDLHLAMRAWQAETGEAYDTQIASARLVKWIGDCVGGSPASHKAVLLFNGDTLHADDQTNQTPKSKHVLDVDTRHFKTLETSIEAMAASVELAAAKHARVYVRVLPGNHDTVSYMALMFALGERYRNDERIRVQKVPGEWFVYQHGKVLLAAHHGDKSKAERMVHFIADQYAELWGKTRHRFLFTGHLHHHKSADIGGVQWEQLRAVTARDAYAVSHAYTARAQLQAITFDREKGEVSRVKVNGF